MGPVGHRGKSGRREFSPEPPSAVLDNLSHQLADAQHTLEVQFTRIAQMQQEIDQLRAKSDREQPVVPVLKAGEPAFDV
jgi:chromosome condensin MukBEF ATPase and DNA-binding subunit MukB